MDSIEQIHLKNNERRANILKGFVDNPLSSHSFSLKEVEENVGRENIYTIELLKGYTAEVLKKGGNEALEKAKAELNDLMPIMVEHDGKYGRVFINKGHMNFDSSSSGGKGNLVKKQITDKTGKQTSRWVKSGEDAKKTEGKPAPENEEQDKEEMGGKPSGKDSPIPKEDKEKPSNDAEDSTKEGSSDASPEVSDLDGYAKEATSEQLSEFIQANSGDESKTEEIAAAQRELDSRGEGSGEGGEQEGSEPEVDFSNPESVKQALSNHPERERIMDLAIDMGVSPGQALQIHSQMGSGKEEAAAVLQQALDALNGGGESEREDDERNLGNDMSETIEDYLSMKDPGGNLEFPHLQEFLDSRPELLDEDPGRVIELYSQEYDDDDEEQFWNREE